MNDWTSEVVDMLRDVIDRIIPRDADPSATDLGVDRYILGQMQAGAVPGQDAIRAGLEGLIATGQGICRTEARLIDGALQAVAAEPWFQWLTELAAEGYYADPGNGGNAEARSWTMIGYEHRLPEGPDGPPHADRADQVVRHRMGDAEGLLCAGIAGQDGLG